MNYLLVLFMKYLLLQMVFVTITMAAAPPPSSAAPPSSYSISYQLENYGIYNDPDPSNVQTKNMGYSVAVEGIVSYILFN